MKLIEFTESALYTADKMYVPEKMLKKRPLVEGYTIDGATSKDLDDGINIRMNGDNYALEVSIADVAQFINMDSELFNIAFERVETRYMKDYNEPMLPRLISERKVSLLPNKLSPTITFNIEVTPDGEIVDFAIRETSFRNLHRLSYPEFDEILEQKEESPEHELFQLMFQFANRLMEIRRNKGALAIYDIKRKIYTNEEGMILNLTDDLAHKSNIVVQEFMIICNKGLAMYFAKNNLPLLYRNHSVKLNTPDRKVILDQMNTAIAEPQHLTALNDRVGLWFEKATYSPIVLGHYGLNEAAYTHVTSPIRRVADLINHQLIKAHLNETRQTYTQVALSALSDELNEAKLEISEAKAEAFKEKAVRALSLKLQSSTEQELIDLENHKFEPILDRAVKGNLLFPNLEEALKKRFDRDTIDAVMVYDLLFKNPELGEEWDDLVTQSLSYAYQTSGMPISILNILMQKGGIDKFETEIKDSDGGFAAKSKVFIEAKSIMPDSFSYASKKKDAISRSAGRLIYQILNFPFVEPKRVVALPKSLKAKIVVYESKKDVATPEVVEERNYVGEMLEFVMKNQNWGNPEFTFTLTGPSNTPTVSCRGEIEINTNSIMVYATSSNKKDAKQMAAMKMMKIIEENYAEDMVVETKEDLETTFGENYVGLIQEYFVQNKIPAPSYKYKQAGTNQQSATFDCTAFIKYLDQKYLFAGNGKTKKEAKQSAAEVAYKEFKKIFESAIKD